MSAKPRKENDPESEKGSLSEQQENEQPDTTIKRRRKEYSIDVFKDWCKSCGLCAAFCPPGCIHMDDEGYPVVEDSSCCTGCGWCEVHCPDFAISVQPRSGSEAGEEQVD